MCKQHVFRGWLRAGIVAFATLGAAALGQAQQSWTLQSPANHPGALLAPQMAYDARHQKVMLFSGTTASGAVADTPNNTWLWDGQQRNWTQVNPLHKPAGRVTAGMAYDAARQQIVMFGGSVGSTTFGDTWVWDGADWTQKFPANSPAARDALSMAYDAARQQVVLFGGSSAGGATLSDTWTWDGNNWTRQFPATSPSARVDHQMAYDEVRQEIVLFGGNDYFDDDMISTTWVWNGSNWIARTPAAYPPGANPVSNTFHFHSMVFDSALQQVVLYGGYCGGVQGATWLWDGTNWTQFTGTGPGARYDTGIAYDSTNQQLVLFGGDFPSSSGFYTFETWTFSTTKPSAAWVQQSPPASPPARGYASMAYDSRRQKSVLFGGIALNSQTFFTDTWTWNGTTWTLAATTGPPGRGLPALAYDELHQQTLLFSGANTTNDTWVWDGTAWTQKFPLNSPAGGYGVAMAYDGARQQMVLFGGKSGTCLTGTWTWDGNNWTAKSPATVPVPSSDCSAAMTYDDTRQQVVLLTGIFGTTPDKTYTWDGTNWTLQSPATPLPQRYNLNGMLAYDSLRQKAVQFGGYSSVTAFLGDTWEWDGGNWAQLISATSPSSRVTAAMAFDPVRQQTVLFGGYGPDSQGVQQTNGDTWTLGPGAATPTVNVTVPAGIQFTFNGVNYTGSQSIAVAAGTYTLATSSPQSSGVGTQAVFSGWSDGGAISHTVTVAAGALNITGTFQTQYLLTASANPSNGGTVTQSSATSNGPYYAAGTLVSVFQSPAAGFTFTGWSGACSGTGACFVTVNAPATVTANYTRPTYLVTINVPAGIQYTLSGLPLTGPGSVPLPAGNWDLVLVSPQAVGPGVQTAFVSWSDGGAASHTITVVSSPITITGTFKTQYLLTATSVPANGGIAQVSPPGPSDPYYDAGSAVIVQATPNAGYDFLYWGGVCSGSNSQCLLVMSAPKTVTANFALSFKWIPLFPANSPSPRLGASMVYDEARQQVVLFGGESASNDRYNDTWVWDGVNWTQKNPQHSPPAGAFLGMAYDSFRQRTVLFGGFADAETWEWDGNDWALKSPAISPPNRGAAVLAYDGANHRVVLFGGEVGKIDTTPLSDTWTWDGATWTQMLPPASPPARQFHSMTWDGARQEVVVYGGLGRGPDGVVIDLYDTWTWNGTTWTQKTPVTVPFALNVNALGYDALIRQVIMAATYPKNDGLPVVTWFWDGANWAQKLLAVTPHPVANASTAYDAARQQFVSFGGQGSSLNITWIYCNNSNPPQYTLTTAAAPAGGGTVTQSSPGQPAPTYYIGTPVTVTATPAAGYGFQSWTGACSGSGACVVTMDAAKSVTANFTNGPLNVTINVPPAVQFSIHGTTYTGTQTIALTPGTYPLTMATPQSAGPGTQLVFQSWSDGLNAANRNILVGGLPLSLTATFQTQYLLTTAASPAGDGTISPSSGYRVAGAVIPVTATANPGYSFVNWSGACSGGGACSVTMNAPQTVTANFAAGAFPVQITVPAGLKFTLNGVTYTTSASVLLAPGSYPLATTAAQSTGAGVQATFVSWSDGGALSHSITVAGAPISITGTFKTQYLLAASAAPANEGSLSLTSAVGVGPFYDPGTVVLVTATAQPGYQFQSWAGACSGASPGCFVTVNAPVSVTANFGVPQTWVQLFPAASPSARSQAVMVWDQARQQAVLFGGLTASGATETWTFDGFNWTLQNPAVAPSQRGGHAMAFDAGASRVVLFGGESFENLSDTWLWDGSHWIPQNPVNHPSPRAGHAMAYDAARGQTVLFGGRCFEPPLGVSCNPETSGDTWVWDGANWAPKSPLHSPPARAEHSMTYDSVNHVVLLFGGVDANGNWLADTWIWNGTDWAQKNPITAPPARFGAALTYDPTRQQAVLFGGSGMNSLLNDTWIWDGVNWQARVPSLSPAARMGAAIAFDPVHGQPVLFGGSLLNQGASWLNDTWVWLTPTINVVPQTPSLARDARGNYQVQITVKNQGNVPLTSISLTSIKLGGVSPASYIGATTRLNVLPGGTTSFIAVFPIASVPGVTASLSFQGVYTAASVVNAAWSGSVRSVPLP